MPRLLKRGLIVVAACLAVTAVFPTLAGADLAGADCCVCSGCPSGGPSCFAVSSCDFLGCEIACTNAGCSDGVLEDTECPFIDQCAEMFGVSSAPASGPALHLSLILVLFTLGAVVLRRRTLPAAVRTAVAILLVLGTAAGIRALTQIRLSGTWALDVHAEAGESIPTETWAANVAVADDGSVSGTVTLSGFLNVDVANVEGTFKDGVISGTLRDGDGPVIAEFEGKAERNWLNGTLTKVPSGETGAFSWHNDQS